MEIAIGTMNPVKIAAVKQAFTGFPEAVFLPAAVSSGVSPQPFSDEETVKGAINRAKNALYHAGADLGIGLEGGIHETGDSFFLCNWGALAVKNGETIEAGGARIKLPQEIGLAVKGGRELGDVMDEYTKQHNVRHKEGAVGIFTAGFVTRTEMFSHIAQLLAGQYLYRLR